MKHDVLQRTLRVSFCQQQATWQASQIPELLLPPFAHQNARGVGLLNLVQSVHTCLSSWLSYKSFWRKQAAPNDQFSQCACLCCVSVCACMCVCDNVMSFKRLEMFPPLHQLIDESGLWCKSKSAENDSKSFVTNTNGSVGMLPQNVFDFGFYCPL